MIKIDADRYIKEPDVIEVGSEKLHVLDAPGHSPGGIMLASYENKIMITGDTIFMGSIGRTDIGGNFQQLMNTIRIKIMENDRVTDDFELYPGHGDDTTVRYEKTNNMFSEHFLG